MAVVCTDEPKYLDSGMPLNWVVLCRNSHSAELAAQMQQLLAENALADVTLVCGSRHLLAHRLVLAACSPFLRTILEDNPCDNVTIVLEHAKVAHVQRLLHFAYQGEVSVPKEEVPEFLQLTEYLKVMGLCGLMGNQSQETDWGKFWTRANEQQVTGQEVESGTSPKDADQYCTDKEMLTEGDIKTEEVWFGDDDAEPEPFEESEPWPQPDAEWLPDDPLCAPLPRSTSKTKKRKTKLYVPKKKNNQKQTSVDTLDLDTPLSEPELPSELSSLIIICDICQKTCDSSIKLSRHLYEDHPETYKGERRFYCQFCDELFAGPRERLYHARTTHNVDPHFQNCQHCTRSFRLKKQLAKHMKLHHTPQENPPPAPKASKMVGKRGKSLKSAPKEKFVYLPYSCKKCPQKFKSKHALQKHQSAEHYWGQPATGTVKKGTNRIVCNICKFPLHPIETLEKHMEKRHPYEKIRITASEVAYECGICHSLFGSKSILTNHMRTGHTYKPLPSHACRHCYMFFKEWKTLKNHMARLHGPKKQDQNSALREGVEDAAESEDVEMEADDVMEESEMNAESRDAVEIDRKSMEAETLEVGAETGETEAATTEACAEKNNVVSVDAAGVETAVELAENNFQVQVMCLLCNKTMNRKSIRRHMRDTHKIEGETVDMEDQYFQVLDETCTGGGTLEVSADNSSQARAECVLCKKSMNRKSIRRHMRDVHKIEGETAEMEKKYFQILDESSQGESVSQLSEQNCQPQAQCPLCVKTMNKKSVRRHLRDVHKIDDPKYDLESGECVASTSLDVVKKFEDIVSEALAPDPEMENLMPATLPLDHAGIKLEDHTLQSFAPVPVSILEFATQETSLPDQETMDVL